MAWIYTLAEMLGWLKLEDSPITQAASEPDHQPMSLATGICETPGRFSTPEGSSDGQRFNSVKEEPATPTVLISQASPPRTPTRSYKQPPLATPGPSTPEASSGGRKYSPPIEDPAENVFLVPSTPTPTTPSRKLIHRNSDGSNPRPKGSPKSPNRIYPYPVRSEILDMPPGFEVAVRKRCQALLERGEQCSVGVPLNMEEVLRLKCFGEQYETYCGRHGEQAKEAMREFDQDEGEYGRYRDWIPKYITNGRDQSLLLKAMREPLTDRDGAGCIYLIDIANAEHGKISIKVGSTKHDAKTRFERWRMTCSLFSNAQLLYPPEQGAELNPSDRPSDDSRPVAWRRKAERLIQLEVKILVQSKAYLQAGWPDVLAIDDDTVINLPNRQKFKGVECSSCKVDHLEIYTLDRAEGGEEWKRFLVPIVERWIKFVNTLRLVEESTQLETEDN